MPVVKNKTRGDLTRSGCYVIRTNKYIGYSSTFDYVNGVYSDGLKKRNLTRYYKQILAPRGFFAWLGD